jgi:hypothetical protein
MTQIANPTTMNKKNKEMRNEKHQKHTLGVPQEK